MKKWRGFLGIVLAFAAPNAGAVELSLRWERAAGGYQHEILLNCAASEVERPFCQELCADAFGCVIPEKYCRNCHGTASALLREFFLGVGTRFVPSEETVGFTEVLPLLRGGYFVAIDARSPVNFYRSFAEPEYLAGFASLCREGEGSPTVLVALSSVRSPVAVPFVACAAPGATTVFRRIESERNSFIGGTFGCDTTGRHREVAPLTTQHKECI